MMSKQVLLCVETNSNSRTDYLYIQSVIKRFYIDDRKIVYRPVFMETKTKYKDKGVVRDINSRIKKFPGETKVIYFIDVDDYEVSYETKLLFDEIENYCKNNGFDFVFFCRDVEDVFWGKPVSDKVKKAKIFNEKNGISSVNEANLCSLLKKRHCSNILNILDKYWSRKKNI